MVKWPPGLGRRLRRRQLEPAFRPPCCSDGGLQPARAHPTTRAEGRRACSYAEAKEVVDERSEERRRTRR
ncbi:MAG: hypothetical protein FWF36_05330, partial [Propionibacteriaceae bacterium]|nr:hypothetical protein [Propionibacteriaceae bacterium]